MNTLREFRGVALLFVLAIATGIAGITGTSALLNDAFEATPEGQGILQINVEVASNLLAFAVGALVFTMQLRRRAAEKIAAEEDRLAQIEATTARKMERIVKEIDQLARTHAALVADIHAPKRFIWDRSAWISAVDHLRDHLTQPGLFYALERFYLAADALRDADHDRALHIWNPLTVFTRKRTVVNMTSTHIENFTVKREALIQVLAQYGYVS
jgi:hypothetical protein